jgi:hypothetical protein
MKLSSTKENSFDCEASAQILSHSRFSVQRSHNAIMKQKPRWSPDNESKAPQKNVDGENTCRVFGMQRGIT